jgi:hypothetical protein
MDDKIYNNLTIPIIRRAFPQMIAEELFQVQPMSGPTGLAFNLKFNYKPSIPRLDIIRGKKNRGYQGNDLLDSGIFYAPYIPLYTHGAKEEKK